MKCEEIRDLFAEEWAGSLAAGLREEFETHLARCAACREEQSSLQELWARIAELPAEQPGPDARPRFYAMLAGYQQGLERVPAAGVQRRVFSDWLLELLPRRTALQFGLAGLLVVLGFLGGYLLKGSQNGQGELAGLRQEVHEMQKLVTLSLLTQQSASDRLKGVSWSNQVSRPDPEFLATLMRTLDYDPNVDVRLAAVDALARFAADASVRDGLIHSLQRQDSPMVQISLIDLLVQLHVRQSVDVLRQLTNDASQNDVVRQRAQWGLQKLT